MTVDSPRGKANNLAGGSDGADLVSSSKAKAEIKIIKFNFEIN